MLGHPYGPNAERGLFRSTDGGATFQKVLYKDENTGAIDVVLDPVDPDIVYCALWEARQGPWENGQFSGPGQRPVQVDRRRRHLEEDRQRVCRPSSRTASAGSASPSRRACRAGCSRPWTRRAATGCIARTTPARHWYRATTDNRVATRESDFAEVKVDPKNPDIVYTASVVTWKSTDGGKTFNAFRGAPGGDDYHRIWINPIDPNIMLIASDQGAIVTVNGGETWSSWLQSADGGVLPRRGGQRVSVSPLQRAAGIRLGVRGQPRRRRAHHVLRIGIRPASRSTATPRPIRSIPTSCTAARSRATIVAPGRCSRSARASRPWRDRGLSARCARRRSSSPPSIRTRCSSRRTSFGRRSTAARAGRRSVRISRAPTRSFRRTSACTRVTPGARARHGGVVYTVAPSYVDIQRIWAGTDDGLIHTTADGGQHWTDVTPPELRARRGARSRSWTRAASTRARRTPP